MSETDNVLKLVKEQMDALHFGYEDGAHQEADELLLQLVAVLALRLDIDVKPIIESYKRVPKWYS